jgi:hypothetical protein
MLIACRGCRRHVRRDSARCPFCMATAATFAVIVLAASTAHAQPSEEREPKPLYGVPEPPAAVTKNAIQGDLGLGVVGLAYERALNPRVAVAISAHVFGTWWGPYFDLPRFSGFGAQIRPSFFLTQDAPRGVYIAPYFRSEAVSAKTDTATGNGVGWSLGTFVGYSFVIGDHVNLRIGGGAQYMSYAVDAGGTRLEWKRFHPALDLVVGYGF